MQLQNLRYFVALARTRHFAAAASACGVTQPTLSAGLVALEQELGKRLVERDRRFIGLTPQGEAILPWAEQALGAVRGLTQAAGTSAQALTGEFRLYTIPAAQPIVGPFGEALLAAYPGLTLAVTSGTSREIEQGLLVNEFDAGLTYLDHEPPANMLTAPLHAEQFVAIVANDPQLAALRDLGNRASWEKLARMPLCLLHQGMQNRRMLDRQFAARGLSVTPRATADNYVSLLSLVRSGRFVSIVPDVYAGPLAGADWCRFVPIAPAAEPRRLGLVVINRDPLGAMARAGLTVAQKMESAHVIDSFYQT